MSEPVPLGEGSPPQEWGRGGGGGGGARARWGPWGPCQRSQVPWAAKGRGSFCLRSRTPRISYPWEVGGAACTREVDWAALRPDLGLTLGAGASLREGVGQGGPQGHPVLPCARVAWWPGQSTGWAPSMAPGLGLAHSADGLG